METQPTQAGKKHEARALLLAMCLEQSELARHQETQRSNLAAVFSTLSTAVIGVITGLWVAKQPFDYRMLPLTLTLTALGLFGYLISTKIFEKSMLHFSLFDAYRNTLEKLTEEEVRESLRPEDVQALEYVQEATAGGLEWESGGDKGGEAGEPKKLQEVEIDTTNHNPVDPRPVAVKRHNAREKEHLTSLPVAYWDLFQLWGWLYRGMSILGLAGTVGAILSSIGHALLDSAHLAPVRFLMGLPREVGVVAAVAISVPLNRWLLMTVIHWMTPNVKKTLRVMTFNVRTVRTGEDYADDRENVWSNRADLNVSIIRRYAPDIIGFQEVQKQHIDTYADALSEYECYLGPVNGDVEPYDFNPVYWKRSRLKRVAAGGFWLSQTPCRYSRGWESHWIRAATWVRLSFTDTGQEFIVLNTHLDHKSEEARQKGSQLIVRRLKTLRLARGPVIVTGDFNCNPDKAAYQIFRDAGYKDTYREANPQAQAGEHTFHAFQGDRYDDSGHHGIRRVDWILTREGNADLTTSESQIVTDNHDPVYPSDHYPVIADITVAYSRMKWLKKWLKKWRQMREPESIQLNAEDRARFP